MDGRQDAAIQLPDAEMPEKSPAADGRQGRRHRCICSIISVFLCIFSCKNREKEAKTLAIEKEHGIILSILLQE